MKHLGATLGILASLATPLGAKVVVIGEDIGGSVDHYIAKYDAHTLAGDILIVDGICWSACAYVTRVPRACATERAIFALHRAFIPKKDGRIYSTKIDLITEKLYPKNVQQLIISRGGLKENSWLYIRGTDLLPLCKG